MADVPKVDRDGGTSVYTTDVGLRQEAGPMPAPDGGLDGGSSLPDGGGLAAGVGLTGEDDIPNDGFIWVPPRAGLPVLNLPLCPYLKVSSGGSTIGQLGHLSDKRQIYVCKTPEKPDREGLMGFPFSGEVDFKNCRAPSSSPGDTAFLSRGVSVNDLNASGKVVAQIPMNMCALRLGAIPLTSNFGDNRPTNIIAYRSDESKAICGKGFLDNSGTQDLPSIRINEDEAKLLMALGHVVTGGMCQKELATISGRGKVPVYAYRITNQLAGIEAMINGLTKPDVYITSSGYDNPDELIQAVRSLSEDRKLQLIAALEQIPAVVSKKKAHGWVYEFIRDQTNPYTATAVGAAVFVGFLVLKEVRESNKYKNSLETYGRNITQEAKDSKLDPYVGRREVFREILNVLGRTQKPNPLLVGKAGTGKTAAIEGLAAALLRAEAAAVAISVPDAKGENNGRNVGALTQDGEINPRIFDKFPQLRGAEIWEINLSDFEGSPDAKYRGGVEGPMLAILKEVHKLRKSGRNIWLFLDEVHLLTTAGTAEGTPGLGQKVKKKLLEYKIPFIGATTPEEERWIARDSALSRRFENVPIVEPTYEHLVEIVNGVARREAGIKKITIQKGVIEEVIKGSAKLAAYLVSQGRMPSAAEPARSLDILRNIVSHVVMNDLQSTGITVKDVEAWFAKRNGSAVPSVGPTCEAAPLPKPTQPLKFKIAVADPKLNKGWLTRLPEAYRRVVQAQAGQILDVLVRTGQLKGAAILPDGTVQVPTQVYEHVLRAAYAVVHDTVQTQQHAAASGVGVIRAGQEDKLRRPERVGEGPRFGEGPRAGEGARRVERSGEGGRREEVGKTGTIETLEERLRKDVLRGAQK